MFANGHSCQCPSFSWLTAQHNQLLFQLTPETLIGTHNGQIRVVEHSSVERRARVKSKMKALESLVSVWHNGEHTHIEEQRCAVSSVVYQCVSFGEEFCGQEQWMNGEEELQCNLFLCLWRLLEVRSSLIRMEVWGAGMQNVIKREIEAVCVCVCSWCCLLVYCM